MIWVVIVASSFLDQQNWLKSKIMEVKENKKNAISNISTLLFPAHVFLLAQINTFIL